MPLASSLRAKAISLVMSTMWQPRVPIGGMRSGSKRMLSKSRNTRARSGLIMSTALRRPAEAGVEQRSMSTRSAAVTVRHSRSVRGPGPYRLSKPESICINLAVPRPLAEISPPELAHHSSESFMKLCTMSFCSSDNW